MKHKNFNLQLLSILTAVCLCVISAAAQTTAFTYQGKLSDAGNPASGNYLLQFKLFDAAAGGTQIGATSPDVFVTVSQGVFSTQLDFGATPFTGADRFLEISVKKNAGDPFTVLSPRQQINSSPYSIRTLSAAQADVALDANKLGGVDASEYVTTASVGNSFIKNSTTPQTGANFNIDSNGVVGGSFGIGTTPASGFKLDVNGQAQIRSGASTGGDLIQLSAASSPRITMTSGSSAKGFITFDNLSYRLFAGSGPTFNPDSGITMIPSSGNIGMGTGAPTSKLEIAAQNGLAITGFQPFMTFRDTNNANKRSILQSADGNLFFYPNDSIGGIPAMTIRNTTGNVGIGTSTPQAKFHVNGSSWFQGDSTPLPAAAGKGIVVGFGGEQGYIQAFDYGTFTAKNLLINNSGGNVGIGTATPQAKLQVAGNIAQDRAGNGVIKAMIHVDRAGGIIRCYNGITGSSTGNCGFVITLPSTGIKRIGFGFPVSDRFVSVTPEYATTCNVNPISCRNAGANFRFFGTDLEVFTFNADNAQDTADAAFMLIIY